MSGLCLPVCTSRQRADAPVAQGGGIAATCASVCGDRCPSSLSGSSKAGHVITLVAVPDERCSLCGPLRNSVFCLESPVSLHVCLLHRPGEGRGAMPRALVSTAGFRHLDKALPFYFTPSCVFGRAVVPGRYREAQPRCSSLGGVGSLTPSCPQRTLGLGCGLGVGGAAPWLALVAAAIVGFSRFHVAMELAPLWFLLAT